MLHKCLPPRFGSIWITIQEQMWIENFQDGGCSDHLGYQNRTILWILNLHVTLMPPIKFQLNPTYSKEEIQDGHHGRHFGYRNNFNNSESSCLPNAPPCPRYPPPPPPPHTHTKFWLNQTYHSGGDVTKIFKMAAMSAILEIRAEWF